MVAGAKLHYMFRPATFNQAKLSVRKTVVFMKKITCCLLLALSFAFVSCKKEKTTNESYILHIDLQYSFDNDKVQVFIDGKEEFNNTVSTNPILGFASGFSIEKESGRHTVAVKLNGKSSPARVFVIDEELYLGISHTEEDSFRFRFSDKPFGYD